MDCKKEFPTVELLRCVKEYFPLALTVFESGLEKLAPTELILLTPSVGSAKSANSPISRSRSPPFGEPKEKRLVFVLLIEDTIEYSFPLSNLFTPILPR
ncbi:hypothetical protein D3C81_1618720 [compost metagenome]